MDFSDQWKSLWAISSVFPAPLLLSPETNSLGPLFFRPCSEPTPLFSSPSLSRELPPNLHPFIFRNSIHNYYRTSTSDFIPSSILSSISLPPQSDSCNPPISHNSLHAIHRSNADLMLFFPTGHNSDCIGYIVFSPINRKIWLDKDGDVFKLQRGLNHRILFISAVGAPSYPLDLSSSGNSVTEGFLLVFTLYSVHWFKVEAKALKSGHLDRPVLVHLAFAEFKSRVIHACWNPHLHEESAVLLESGRLLLFDLSSCSGVSKLPVKLRGTLLRVLGNDLGAGSLDLEKGGWLSCEFSWHPRILIVSCSSAVFLVDLRCKESSITILTTIDMCDSIQVHSLQTDRFTAFCKASFDEFYFSVATEHNLLLFDIRQPSMPVLKWDHNLDKPCYISMHRLSELRPSRKDGVFERASESGFAILAGSFWNCEFCLFFYGPPLPSSDTSVASKISRLCNSLYAWDLPSAVSLSGCECRCGSCLVREDFSKATLPVSVDWQRKKDLVLGFCILSKELGKPLSQNGLESASESDDLGGFTLIRLMSSGRLELQQYCPSPNYVSIKCDCKEASLDSESSLLYSWDQEDDAPTKFKNLKLDYLFGHLNDNLVNILASKMQSPRVSFVETEQGGARKLSCTEDARELIRGSLNDAGIDSVGSVPSTTNLLSSITFPTSIREIATNRIWAGLPLYLLQMAFFKHSDLVACQTNKPVEFLDVPGLPPQVPPFFLRRPYRKWVRVKWRWKSEQGEALAGPVLPLSILRTIEHINRSVSSCDSIPKIDFSSETELTNYCNEVLTTANNLLSLDDTVSLSSDNEKWAASQELRYEKDFFLYETQARSDGATICNEKKNTAGSIKDETAPTDRASQPDLMSGSTIKDHKFTTFVSRIPNKQSSANNRQEELGLEFFDDLSPVQLKFDSPATKFGPEEVTVFKCLKRQFSKWQESFKPYEDFCTFNKIPKRT